MFLERNFAILGDLLEPSETIAVRGQRGNDVVFAVAVHVVGKHVGAAVAGRERKGVEFPNGVALDRFWLFPPAIFLEQVHFTVAIHVADAQAMGELVIILVR